MKRRLPPAPTYPEHERLRALGNANQTIGDFVTWLGEHGYEICRRVEPASRYQSSLDEVPPQRGGRGRERLGEEFCSVLELIRDSAIVHAPVNRREEWWIAQFFGIDEAKLEAEKRAMLEHLRKINDAGAKA